MNRKTKKQIIIGIIVTAIGGVITAVTLKKTGYVLRLLVSFLAALWHGLTTYLQMPIWLVLIGIAWILFTLYIAAKIYIESLLEPKFYKHYVRDEFWGLTWRWDYSGRMLNRPWCYCLHCDTMLVCSITVPHQLDLIYGNQPSIVIHCEQCQRKVYAGEAQRE